MQSPLHLRKFIQFIGGPYDGQALPVPQPILREAELRVLPRGPHGRSAFYALGDDGRFHYLPLPPPREQPATLEGTHAAQRELHPVSV